MFYHRGHELQRGRGFGSILKGLYRRIVPIAKKGINIGKRILKSDYVKHLSNSAASAGAEALKNVAYDYLSGEKPISESAKTNIDQAKKRLAEAVMGRGCKNKRRKKSKRKITNKEIVKAFNLLD